MASKSIRILKPEDSITHEQFLAERQNYTDVDARKLGYPSIDVMHLADKLTEIAGAWREMKSEALIEEYRITLHSMILGGYDVDTLPIQDQLPPELMPKLPPAEVRSAILEAYGALEQ